MYNNYKTGTFAPYDQFDAALHKGVPSADIPVRK